ncbi:MAG TPA: metallophosphoesterase [Candidatus Polarisedimenticolaceae bacterium]|nr:metallophosphoesterase [Candidatus Polarisedimenticolaceae bacterium]
MSRIFAIADLHLSTSGAKPMDIFGPEWTDHAERMARAWDETVRDEDRVLLPGDLSWARDLAEAQGDLAWIGRRPGSKYLLRGNHDSWWKSAAQVRNALPPRCFALQNDAYDLGDAVLVGARGWTAPDDPIATPEDGPVFLRELERLRLSIADADRRLDRALPRIAMLHFPPWLAGRPPTDLVATMQKGGIEVCVYGHLHGADHARATTGERDGIVYQLVASDAVGFTPVPVAVTLRGRNRPGGPP